VGRAPPRKAQPAQVLINQTDALSDVAFPEIVASFKTWFDSRRWTAP
jgi:hypothetical protein